MEAGGGKSVIGGNEVGVAQPRLEVPSTQHLWVRPVWGGGSQGDDISVSQFHGDGEGVLPLCIHGVDVSTALQEEARQAAMGQGGHTCGKGTHRWGRGGQRGQDLGGRGSVRVSNGTESALGRGAYRRTPK